MTQRKIRQRVTGTVFLDSFSTDLGDMPYRDKRNDEKVKAVLRRTKRFSAFEIDDALAPTITRLFRNGSIKAIGGNYPWTEVEVVK